MLGIRKLERSKLYAEVLHVKRDRIPELHRKEHQYSIAVFLGIKIWRVLCNELDEEMEGIYFGYQNVSEIVFWLINIGFIFFSNIFANVFEKYRKKLIEWYNVG